MKIVGCDLHAKQQTIAMVDTETGEFTEKTLAHEGNKVREFYAGLEGPVVVGIEATGAMQWFLQLLEELGIECRVGHPAKIRAKETRKQKHDRRDARLELELLMDDRTQSRTAPRACSVESSGAESTPGLGSVSLQQSKAGRTSASVRAVAEADQGARPAGGRRSQAATPGVAAAHPSRSGADHGIGHRRVPGRRAPVCHWQPGRELHRDDPV